MQPGIAFPRALQGETLDFSEPKPNRCWLLESHQKQAFMLFLCFSLFPLSHSLSLSCFFFSLTFMLFCLLLSFLCPPFLIFLPGLSSSRHFLTLFPPSHSLSFSLSKATSSFRNLFAVSSKQPAVCSRKSVELLLCQTSSVKVTSVRCLSLCFSTSEQRPWA